MTGLIKVIYALAFTAVLAMQPIRQQYCTASNAYSSVDAASCCADGCDHTSSDRQGLPCCIEVFSESPFVPTATESAVPHPLVYDVPAFQLMVCHSELRPHDLLQSKVMDVDPPPELASAQVRHRVRQI